jgi:hypothetical protein
VLDVSRSFINTATLLILDKAKISSSNVICVKSVQVRAKIKKKR